MKLLPTGQPVLLTPRQQAIIELIRLVFFYFLASFLGMLILWALFPQIGFANAEDFGKKYNEMLKGEHPDLVMSLRVVIGVSSIFSFLITGLLFAFTVRKTRAIAWLQVNRLPSVLFLIGSAVLVFTITPLITWIYQLNQTWFDANSDNSKTAEALILNMDTVADMLANVLVIGIIAALGEEVLFRGVLQKILYKMLPNPHLAIWAAAAIFSFVHGDPAGFLPRMLLGAVLGYVFYWSGSLWTSIAVHALHNSWQILAVWHYQIDVVNSKSQQVPILSLIFSVLLSGAIVYFLYRNRVIIIYQQRPQAPPPHQEPPTDTPDHTHE